MNNEKKNRKIDNFEKYLAYKGITENRATRECDLAQGLLGNARKKELYDIGYKSIDKILKTYTDLSERFLLYGEEPMIIEAPVSDAPRNDKPNLCKHTDEEFEELIRQIEVLKTENNMCQKEISLLKDTIDFMKSLVKGNGQS